jgi:hypothetical protein
MIVELIFDRDKRFKLVDIGHRGIEGNTTVLRTMNVVFSPSTGPFSVVSYGRLAGDMNDGIIN